jgi:hypothetical protein
MESDRRPLALPLARVSDLRCNDPERYRDTHHGPAWELAAVTDTLAGATDTLAGPGTAPTGERLPTP